VEQVIGGGLRNESIVVMNATEERESTAIATCLTALSNHRPRAILTRTKAETPDTAKGPVYR